MEPGELVLLSGVLLAGRGPVPSPGGLPPSAPALRDDVRALLSEYPWTDFAACSAALMCLVTWPS